MAEEGKIKAAEIDDEVKIDNKEWEEAEKAAKNSKTQLTISLNSPFEWEGKIYEELHFDFGKLTGRDSLDIEKEMRAHNIPLVSPAFSGEYIVRVALRACDSPIGLDMLEALPLTVFNRIRNDVSSFLLRSEI